jgi:hypothetical protein
MCVPTRQRLWHRSRPPALLPRAHRAVSQTTTVAHCRGFAMLGARCCCCNRERERKRESKQLFLGVGARRGPVRDAAGRSLPFCLFVIGGVGHGAVVRETNLNNHKQYLQCAHQKIGQN